MRDVITWPRAVSDEDRPAACESEITEIYGQMSEMNNLQKAECERLRERIESLEARVPARSWLGAFIACLRAQRYGRHA